MGIQPASMYPGPAGAMNSMDPVALPAARKAEETSARETSGRTLDSEHVKRMVREIEQHLNSMNVSLNFTPYGENGEKMAVIVSDKETGKVVREIPPKELQDLYVKMNELIGIMFNRHI